MLTWELVGAVIGAGLASGREIASFFSRYGACSWGSIFLAVAVMVMLSGAKVTGAWEKRWTAVLWRWLLKLLLLATGGAMLSGAGELAALTAPWAGAYWSGMAGTLLLAWVLAHWTMTGLAWVSRLMIGVLVMLICLGLTIPPMRAVNVESYGVAEVLVRGITYGGFNAALQIPILSISGEADAQKQRRARLLAGMCIVSVLLLGNALLMRHPALLGESMPFIRMLTKFGKVGYCLGAVCLYLAILSTLTACLRGLGRHPLYAAGIVVSALLGFAGVVEVLYPLLGGGCFLMLAAAKFVNSTQAPFISRRDML